MSTSTNLIEITPEMMRAVDLRRAPRPRQTRPSASVVAGSNGSMLLYLNVVATAHLGPTERVSLSLDREAGRLIVAPTDDGGFRTHRVNAGRARQSLTITTTRLMRYLGIQKPRHRLAARLLKDGTVAVSIKPAIAKSA